MNSMISEICQTELVHMHGLFGLKYNRAMNILKEDIMTSFRFIALLMKTTV